MTRTQEEILAGLYSQQNSSNTHTGVLDDVSNRYNIGNELSTQFNETTRLKDFQNAMQNQIQDALLEAQKVALSSGKSESDVKSRDYDNFENDELSKFYKNELTSLVTGLSKMSASEMKIQKKRITSLSEGLANSDAKEKDFLMNQYAQSLEFIEQDYEKKFYDSKRITEGLKDMAGEYIDIQAVYSGFFDHNPLAMIALKMGKKMWDQHRKNKKDEETLHQNDVNAQRIAIQDEQDKMKMAEDEARRENALREHRKTILVRDSKEAERQAHEENELRARQSSLLTRNERNGGNDDDSSLGGVSSGSGAILGQDSDNVAEQINDAQNEKKDRKTENDYYQSSTKWQKQILKLLGGSSGSGGLIGAGGIGALGGAGIGSNGSNGSSGSGGILGGLGLGAGGLALMKDKIKGLFGGGTNPHVGPPAPGGNNNSMLKKGFDFLKQNKKMAAVLTGGALVFGVSSALSDTEGGSGGGEGKIERNYTAGSSQKDINNDVATDSVTAIGADMALTSLSMLKAVKAIPGVGTALGGVGDGALEYAQGGSAGSALAVGAGGALSGAATGAIAGAFAGPIGALVGGMIGGIGGAMASSALFGDTDKEKSDNLTSRNLDKRGIIDRNDLIPFEDSKLLEPSRLKELSINELKSLVAIDDWSDEDLELIKQTMEIKQGYRDNLSNKMVAHLDKGKVGEVLRSTEKLGIVDIDNLIPFDTSEILKPEELMKLSIKQLQQLLQSDDFNSADMRLIQETIEIKSGKRPQGYTAGSLKRIKDSKDERAKDKKDTEANATVEDLASQGLLDLDYLGTSEIEDVGKLSKLSGDTLQKVLDFKDWNTDDTKLLEELIEQKKSGKKLSKDVQDRVNKSNLEGAEAKGYFNNTFMGDNEIGDLSDLATLDIETLKAMKDSGLSEEDQERVQSVIDKKGQKITKDSVTKRARRDNKRKPVNSDRNNSSLTNVKSSVAEGSSEKEIISGMLNEIGKAESNGDYNAEYGGGKFSGGKADLSKMTIGEVKAHQKKMLNTQKAQGKGAGQRSSAVGKYQFISNSLKEAQELSGLSDDDLFNAENQDKLGEDWLRKRGGLDKYLKSDKTAKDGDAFQNKVAGQWASMKNTKGRGQYDGDGMNTARHSLRGEINQLGRLEPNNQKFADDSFNLESQQPRTAGIVAQIENTNNEIQSKKQSQSNQPVIVNNTSNNSTGGGGGSTASPNVGSARNNESTLSKVNGGYLLNAMS